MFVSVGREAVEGQERALGAHIVKLVDGALTLMARRVESSRSYRDTGHASAAEQIADVEGTSKAAAKAKVGRTLTGLRDLRALGSEPI